MDHRGEVLRGLTICWCRIEEQHNTSKGLSMVQQSIRSTLNMLTAILEREANVPEEYIGVTDSDKRLQNLLSV